MIMDSSVLKNRFIMRYMPKLYEGNYWEAMRDYLDSDMNYYHLLDEFIDDDSRNVFPEIFGIGEDKFWCYESSIRHLPMYDFTTIMDIVEKMEEIHVEVCTQGDDPVDYSPVYDEYNIMCATENPHQNIILNSIKFMTSMDLFLTGTEFKDTVCNTKKTHEFGIKFDGSGNMIDPRYWDDSIDKKVYERMIPLSYGIDEVYVKKIADKISEMMPNTVFKEVEEDFISYTFTTYQNIKNISLANFHGDLESLNVVVGSIEDLILDGKPLLEYYNDEWYNEYASLYEKLYSDVLKESRE